MLIMFSIHIAFALLVTMDCGVPVLPPTTERTIENQATFAPEQKSNSSFVSGVSYNDTEVPEPQLVRRSYGIHQYLPQLEDATLHQQNPDILASPDTDAGDVCESTSHLLIRQQLTSL